MTANHVCVCVCVGQLKTLQETHYLAIKKNKKNIPHTGIAV